MEYALPFSIAVAYGVALNLGWWLAVRRADAHTKTYASHTPEED